MTHKVRMTLYRSWIQDTSTSKKANATKFCPTCGTALMGQRGPSIGVNVRKKAISISRSFKTNLQIDNKLQVRAFKDFDEQALEIRPYNGADLEPQYIPPHGPEESDLDQPTKRYRGSCHCGNVSYDLQSKALEEIGVTSCNCSICSRVCLLFITPSPTTRYTHTYIFNAHLPHQTLTPTPHPTERRPLDLPLQKRRLPPWQFPPDRIPLRTQSRRPRLLFDVRRAGCEFPRAARGCP